MSNDRLVDFHPLPKGLYRGRKFRRLGTSAKLLLLIAHQFADDTEADGIVSDADFPILAGYAGLPPSCVDEAIAQMRAVGLLAATETADDFALVDFRGLSPEALARNRERGREKQRKRRAQQSDHQMYPGDNPRNTPGDNPGEFHDQEGEGDRE